MIQVRKRTFETNSSSCHSLTVMDKNEYEKWEKGLGKLNIYEDELILNEDLPEEEYEGEHRDKDLYTLEEYEEYYEGSYETFAQTIDTKNMDSIVVFGYYGHD